jgi:dihydroorotase
MGASNDNLAEVLRTDGRRVCGVKIFMGSSTGNMLVDNLTALEGLFSKVPILIATHCEDEATVRENEKLWRERFGEQVPMAEHAHIRGVEACWKSSSFAVDLAKKYNTRLHILHLTTEEELELFTNTVPLAQKRITSEVCVHHLYFSSDDYARLGSQIKCNPAIKDSRHRRALRAALLDDRLDIIATDHAPHTWEEKQQSYFSAPSGVPLVQHALQMMLELYHEGEITLTRMVDKMSHAPAVCFQMDRRGFLDEGYWADLAIVDVDRPVTVHKEGLFYKCGWSPFLGHTFRGCVETTIVSGHLAWHQGAFNESRMGQRLEFLRG